MTTYRERRVTLGDFRDVCDIYSDSSDDTDEQQAYGGLPFVSDVPCSIEHRKGHERQQDTFVTLDVTMHYLEDITETMEVSVTQGPFTGKTLNIQEVEPVRVRGRPQWLRLGCLEVT